ncbi:uncharacterized protein TM35_000061540 [Trypanosoma theileri]|uniref:Guanylate cyclase domain-containing protein n=1 Tax=Trypanosoma theileri TaxID=67003 RepID=A0A1X0P3L6_9TRYP|nr:uncharacterized protein TM35_000061540 [Trypanosoma theileri]ORC91149.1 hypothetical protein TM35_000061540 [Trypanosoma theileri]
MASESPSNEWETPTAAGAVPPTGVYGASRIPGTYLKTMTGVQRGEELFHRPELERPWRTTSAQKHAMALALKEKEIEELIRKCSSLRTQLGNAKHDSKYLEYAVNEKAKSQIAEMQKEMDQLKESLATEKKEKEELKISTEHQIRLLRTQQEKDLTHLRNETRLLNTRCEELTRIYQQQVDDVKKAAARELEHVEKLCNGRAEEMVNELRAARENHKAAEERSAAEVAASKNLLHRIETDYKERIRAAEERVDEVRTRLEAENKKLGEELTAARKDSRHATEQLSVALANQEDILVHFKQWDAYILRMLDAFYTKFMETAPEQAVEPHDPELIEAPSLYGPRTLLEDPMAKVTLERIVHRLIQLKHTKLDEIQRPSNEEPNLGAVFDDLSMKQERLSRAFREIEEKCLETKQFLNRTLSRLYFFSDDLEDAVGNMGSVEPPQKNVIFVCLGVFKGNHLWAEDEETARASVALMNTAIRPKMVEYGGYECFSDGTSMLLAFDDPIAACRFGVESQSWLMNLPWPKSLLRVPWGMEEYSIDNTLLFRGLRLSMAIHTGDTFVEPSGIPSGDSYRCHYYGRAVSQVIHACSLAQGGQVIVTESVWDLCAPRQHELGACVMRELGKYPIVSFNKEKNSYEDEPLFLHQILPQRLKDRMFKEIVVDEATHVLSIAKMRRSILSVEIEGVERRRSSLKEIINLADEELMSVDRCIHALMQKSREVKSYFHLLPPTEMVTQMDDLYALMEKIAARASDLRGDLRSMDHMHEELAVQTRGLREYCSHHASAASREEELQLRAELMQSHFEVRMREIGQQHIEQIERLQRELRERDQLIQKLFRELQHSQKQS